MDDEKNRKTNDAAPENKDEQTGGGMDLALARRSATSGWGLPSGFASAQRSEPRLARQPSANSPTILSCLREATG